MFNDSNNLMWVKANLCFPLMYLETGNFRIKHLLWLVCNLEIKRQYNLSHLSMTTEKTTALTIWTFVSKVMSAKLLDVLSRLVIAFLPRSKCLLILWLQSPSVVILEPKKIKSATVSTKIIGWDKNQNRRISWVSNFLSFQETAMLSKERSLAPPCPHDLPQSRLLY